MTPPIFKYPDTNSSRANIEPLNEVFANQKIAIIGMGGTGSYILDLVTKTPVSEIHIYDNDEFLLHNAFRAPGAISGEEMERDTPLKKVDYYHGVYSKMHTGIFKHEQYVQEEHLDEFTKFTMVFICVDKNKVRSMLTKGLLKRAISFIDTGLGVKRIGNELLGTIRITTGRSEKKDHLASRIGEEEFEENEYSTNIQIADLNCLNATLAVLKWKKFCDFYQDIKEENNTLYFINTNKILNEDHTTPIC